MATKHKGQGPLKALTEGVAIAFEALAANKLRAVLAMLGIAIGVGVVVTVASVVTGIRTQVMAMFEASDPESFMVMPFDFTEVRFVSDGSGRPPWWNRPDLTHQEIRRIQSLPAVAEAIPGFDFNAAMSNGSTALPSFAWKALGAGWPAFTLGDFTAGRDFTHAEVEQSRAVVVIAQKIADLLFHEQDPIGKRVRVTSGRRASNVTFTVIGVFQMEESMFGTADMHIAFTPYTTAEKRLKARTRFSFLGIQVVPKEESTGIEAQDQVTTALRSMRGVGPGEENNFALIRGDQMAGLFNQMTGMFFGVMIALSSVGMMVGGIGVVGIMLISVTERTREIGIRKALGATRREILWQFLIEASVLTLLGGMSGLLIGWGASELISAISPLPARIPLWSVFASVILAVVTGILFGLLPAVRASKLDPVDALRYE